MAHVLKCPVYTLFCLRRSKGYDIHCELLAERVTLPRKERLEQVQIYLNEYIRRMENYCKLAPLQWFNFYPYWVDPDKQS